MKAILITLSTLILIALPTEALLVVGVVSLIEAAHERSVAH